MAKIEQFGKEGRYRVVRELGRGGMGAVYLAVDEVLGRQVAVKVVSGSLQGSSHATARFRREARVLSKLRHPNLVEIYEVDFESDPPYMVMEFLAGEDLDALSRHQRVLAPDAARRVLLAMADALAYLHENRILHRDLKPGNILLGNDRRPRLMDFGLTLPMDHTRMTQDDQTLGTPLYMPPEVVKGEDHSPAGDVYQLGMTVHMALTGRHPYGECSGMAELLGSITSGVHARQPPAANVPDDLRRAIAACWAPDPAERPRDGRALVKLLRRTLLPGDTDASGLERPDLVPGPEPAATQEDLHLTPAGPLTPVPGSRPSRSARSGALPTAPLPRRAAMVLALALALIVALGMIRSRFLTSSSATESPVQYSLDAVAREFAVLPDGFHLVLPAPTSYAPRWRLERPPAEPRQGTMERSSDGWSLDLRDLAGPGPGGRLSLFDGERLLGDAALDLPAQVFLRPPTARFGVDALSLSWALHGTSTLDLVVEDSYGARLAHQRVTGGAVSLSLPKRNQYPLVRYRLSLAGSTVATGAGLVALSERFRLPLPAGAPPRLEVFPLDHALVTDGTTVFLGQEPNLLFACAPTPSASGTVLREAGRSAVSAGAGRIRAVLPGRVPGEAVLATAAPGEVLVRRVAFTTGETTEVKLPGTVGNIRAARLGDGRLVLAERLEQPPTAATTTTVRVDVLDADCRRALAALELAGHDALALATLGSHALLAVQVGERVGLRLLRVPPGGAPALAWSSPESRPSAPDRNDRPSCALAALPGRGALAAAVGDRLTLVTPGVGSEGLRVRELPLPTHPSAVLCTVLPLDGRSLFVGAVQPLEVGLSPGGRVKLYHVDGATDAVTTVTVPKAVVVQFRWTLQWSILRHRGLLYVPVGRQVFVLRDEPRASLVTELICPENIQYGPILAGGSVFVSGTGRGIYGLDLVEP